MTPKTAEKERAVTPTNGASTALAQATNNMPGLSGEASQSDVVMPVCSLVQAQSQDKGEEGKFWFPDGTVLTEMNAVVLNIIFTRTLWASLESELGILCKSGDRRMGIANHPQIVLDDASAAEGQQYIPCSECPRQKDEENWVKDGCRFGFTLLMWEKNLAFPFLYFVKGTHVLPVKRAIVSPAIMRATTTGKADPWASVYQWKPRQVQKKFKFWVPEIVAVEEVSEGDQARYEQRSLEMSDRAKAQIEEDPGPVQAEMMDE